MPPSRSHQFGPFRLDAAARVLFRGSERVALTPRAVDLLIVLVEAQGRPVGKDELLRQVWAGTVVEEGSLASHVSFLRKALGEGFIETLPKRGYRFIGPITAQPALQPSAAPAAHATPGREAADRMMIAVLPFETRGGTRPHDDFGGGLAEELIASLSRLASPRLGLVARGDAPTLTHRLEGSVRSGDSRVRINAQLVRLSDSHQLWADSYERPAHDVLAVQAEVARTITREVKARLLPLRTLTFLFTALESGHAASSDAPTIAATQRHDALLREAITRHGGEGFSIAADNGLCVAFPDARTAVLAAVDAQRALGADDATVQPCIGLHSGAVEEGEDEALGGPTLARAARVAAAAQPGQILLTAATVALLDRVAPSGGEWSDLGDHRLRGFTRPERLYQLNMPGLRSDFPPIRTQQALRTNLPPALTMFVGRQHALAQVRERLQRSRMVTLVGAGGTGKTRLSLEAATQLASEFPDGVWLVELAQLADARLVPNAIADALGARAEGDISPLIRIEASLRGQRVLVVLDNCEHLLDEAATVAQAMLRALPQLQLLASSRQALGIDGETVYRVPSMTLPATASSPTPAEVIASEAGQLFVERAAAVQPAFALSARNAAAVAQISRQLDGIPLAIELAAARLTALSVEDIARRLDDRFRLLTGGLRTALPRQRTLRALVDWSYELLSADEQALLDTLSVFAGGFSLDGAERVCADLALHGAGVLDAIEQLVAKSLLLAETQDGSATRYRLLETIRQYGQEKLQQRGLADAARRRHFAYCLDLAETGARMLAGPLALEWLDRLEAEHDNLRAALDAADLAHAGAHALDYTRLAAVLRSFWDTRGHYTEGWARLEPALACHTARDAVRLDALIGAGLSAYRLAHTQRSDDLLSEAILLAQELGHAGAEAEALLWLACARMPLGSDAFEPLLLRGLPLARAAGDRRLETLTLMELGRAALDRGQHAQARNLFQQSAELGRDAGCVIDTPTAIQHAGMCALEQLDFATAHRLLDDALVQHRRIGSVHDAAVTLELLGQLAFNEDRLADARALSAESLGMFRALHDPKCGARTAIAHATVLNAMGDGAAALPHAESAVASYRELGFAMPLARALCTVGCIHARLGQGDAARRALFSGLVEQQRAHRDTPLPDLLEAIAALHADAPAAPRLLGNAAAVRERLNVPLLPTESAERDRRTADVQARHAPAAFDLAFAAGRALARDDAIQAALALQQGT